MMNGYLAYKCLGSHNLYLSVQALDEGKLSQLERFGLLDGINENIEAICWLNANPQFIQVEVIINNLRHMYPVFVKNIDIFIENEGQSIIHWINNESLYLLQHVSIQQLAMIHKKTLKYYIDKMHGYIDIDFILSFNINMRILHSMLIGRLTDQSIKEELIKKLMHPNRIERYISTFGIDAIDIYTS